LIATFRAKRDVTSWRKTSTLEPIKKRVKTDDQLVEKFRFESHQQIWARPAPSSSSCTLSLRQSVQKLSSSEVPGPDGASLDGTGRDGSDAAPFELDSVCVRGPRNPRNTTVLTEGVGVASCTYTAEGSLPLLALRADLRPSKVGEGRQAIVCSGAEKDRVSSGVPSNHTI
jgi:hypothetical protein